MLKPHTVKKLVTMTEECCRFRCEKPQIVAKQNAEKCPLETFSKGHF